MNYFENVIQVHVLHLVELDLRKCPEQAPEEKYSLLMFADEKSNYLIYNEYLLRKTRDVTKMLRSL